MLPLFEWVLVIYASGPGGDGTAVESLIPNQSGVLPQVQKSEKPSHVILKMMEAITKRVGKVTETRLNIV